jgi:hypothetical protein
VTIIVGEIKQIQELCIFFMKINNVSNHEYIMSINAIGDGNVKIVYLNLLLRSSIIEFRMLSSVGCFLKGFGH